MDKYKMFQVRIRTGTVNGGPGMEASTQNLIQVENIFWNKKSIKLKFQKLFE